MKKILYSLFLFSLISTLSLGFVSCNNDDDDDKDSSSIVGTWISNMGGEQVTFTFKKDGTGTLRYSYEGENEINDFTYKVTGHTIIITYDDDDEQYRLGYDLEEGDVLWLTDEEGDTYAFYKR